MASNINASSINGAFPIAGQDNDSGGFRDNFTNIRTNLTFAKAEIEDLQNKVILKAPLTGSSTVTNNFNGSLLTNAQISSFTESVMDQGIHTGAVTCDFVSGSFQKITTNGPIGLSFPWTGVLSGVYAKMRVWINVASVTHLITFPAAVTMGNTAIIGLAGSNVMTPPSVGNYLFEFGTIDAGGTVSISLLVGPLGNSELSAIVELQNAVNVINGNITTINSNISSLTSNVTELQNNVITINNTLTSSDANIAALQSTMLTVEEIIIGTSANVLTIQGNITTLTSDVANVVSNVSTIQGNIVTLTTDVSTINSNVANVVSNVTTLQNTVVFNNVSNNLNGNVITGVTQVSSIHAALPAGPNAITIGFSTADLHVIDPTGVVTLDFAAWPTGSNIYSRFRVLFRISNVAHTITFPASISAATGLTNAAINGVSGQVLTPAVGNYLFEFSSYDNGSSVFIEQIIHP